ncbi:hypothetical protein D3C86_2267760 [compost metagenome]
MWKISATRIRKASSFSCTAPSDLAMWNNPSMMSSRIGQLLSQDEQSDAIFSA